MVIPDHWSVRLASHVAKAKTKTRRAQSSDTKHPLDLSLTQYRIYMLPLALLRGGQGHPVVRFSAFEFPVCVRLRSPARCPVPAQSHTSSHLTQRYLQLVELKSGETYNGHLVQCDSWMNMHLKEVRHVAHIHAP